MATGMGCYHHPSQQAVAQCAGCGKGICRDCVEVYGVTSGEYAGRSLCYECTAQLVSRNIAEVEAWKKSLSVWRLLFGEGKGMAKGLGDAVNMGSNLASGSYAGCFAGFLGIFKIVAAPIVLPVKLHLRNKKVKQLEEIIANDQIALQEMRDYFTYTQVMEQEKEKEASSIDLSQLVSQQGGSLFENKYAKAVLEKGEKAAQTSLRESVVQISANGEIIRSIITPKKGKAA